MEQFLLLNLPKSKGGGGKCTPSPAGLVRVSRRLKTVQPWKMRGVKSKYLVLQAKWEHLCSTFKYVVFVCILHIFSLLWGWTSQFLGFAKKGNLISMSTYMPSLLPKGQLISKCLFGAIVSTKKPTTSFKNFCPSI